MFLQCSAVLVREVYFRELHYIAMQCSAVQCSLGENGYRGPCSRRPLLRPHVTQHYWRHSQVRHAPCSSQKTFSVFEVFVCAVVCYISHNLIHQGEKKLFLSPFLQSLKSGNDLAFVLIAPINFCAGTFINFY